LIQNTEYAPAITTDQTNLEERVPVGNIVVECRAVCPVEDFDRAHLRPDEKRKPPGHVAVEALNPVHGLGIRC
jgi:hypothetical protein